MSSAIKAPSQIPVRTKFFLRVAAPVQGELDYESSAVILNGQWPVAPIGSVMSQADFSAASSYFDLSGESLLMKDLGRQVIVYSSTTPGEAADQLAIFREVQLVAGAATEGVSGAEANGYGSVFVKVWDADGSGVVVVRTG